MGFNLKTMFDEINDIYKSYMPVETKLTAIAVILASSERYAKECGML